jgi:diguanylate cyclase (GGDEF)-like protein
VDLIYLNYLQSILSGFFYARSYALSEPVPIDYKAQYLKEKLARERAENLLQVQTTELKHVQQALARQESLAHENLQKTLSKLHLAQNELKKLVHSDILTNLPNRKQFEIELGRELARSKRYNRQLAVLYLDIDFFKKVNDSLGHQIGDLVLQDVAKRLTAICRADECVARLGGDEFALILTEIGSCDQVTQAAQRILDKMKVPFKIFDHTIHIGTSIGIAVFPTAGLTAIELHKNADIALHSAKNLGRNTYQFFTLALHQQFSHLSGIETELHFALERCEFYLVYQPTFDLVTGCMTGMETLLRWKNGLSGNIPPAEFIPVAEENGLIIEIGEWVLQTACKQFALWREQYKNLTLKLAINVSPKQLQQKSFVSMVKQVLKETNIPPECLELEITETSLIAFLGTMEDGLYQLRSLGVRFSIDDFGTGYSSLSRLKELPIQTIKIDRTFVNDIDHNNNGNLIIKSTIELGKALGLNIIAEGVETLSQLQFLKKHDCPQAQGYYYSQPLPADQILAFIQREAAPSISS